MVAYLDAHRLFVVGFPVRTQVLLVVNVFDLSSFLTHQTCAQAKCSALINHHLVNYELHKRTHLIALFRPQLQQTYSNEASKHT